MSISSRFAGDDDFDWLFERCGVPDEQLVRDLISCRQFMVAESEGTRDGLLHLGFFYGKTPMIQRIHVEANKDAELTAERLLAFLEDRLREMNFQSLMSGSNSIEGDADAWHERSGFEKSSLYSDASTGETIQLYQKKLSPSG